MAPLSLEDALSLLDKLRTALENLANHDRHTQNVNRQSADSGTASSLDETTLQPDELKLVDHQPQYEQVELF